MVSGPAGRRGTREADSTGVRGAAGIVGVAVGAVEVRSVTVVVREVCSERVGRGVTWRPSSSWWDTS